MPTNKNSSPMVSRRVVVRNASWAFPALAVSVASAPAYAASVEDKGLHGWVLVSNTCNSQYDPPKIEIKPYKSYPNGGLWVTGVPKGEEPQNAKMTFYFDENFNLDWEVTSHSDWSYISKDPSAKKIDGYQAWTTKYSGSWRLADDGKTFIAENSPSFATYMNNAPVGKCPEELDFRIRRTVTIHGEVFSFLR